MILYPSLFISPSPGHLRQPYHTPSNPPQLVQQYLQLSCGIQRSNIPCAHAHLFSTMKQVLLTPTTGFLLVYDLGSPVVSTPAGRGSTSPLEGGPVNVVAHFFYSNPSLCKSFLVSSQVVTNPLLVG